MTATVKLGLSSYALAWSAGIPGFPASSQPLDAFGLLTLADTLGVHVLQYADNLPLHMLSESACLALKKEAQKRDIAIEIGTRGIGVETLLTYLHLAQYFESPVLRVVMDTADHHPSIEEAITQLTPLMPRFADANVTLAIENHDRFKAAALAEMMARMYHPNIGICLDTVNSLGALESPEVVVAALKPYVVNLHVKDFIVRRASHNLGFVVEGVPAGQGMLDIPWLLRELMAEGRSFSAILEQWVPPADTPDATAARERAWAAEGVAYLRQHIQE